MCPFHRVNEPHPVMAQQHFRSTLLSFVCEVAILRFGTARKPLSILASNGLLDKKIFEIYKKSPFKFQFNRLSHWDYILMLTVSLQHSLFTCCYFTKMLKLSTLNVN